MPSDEMNPFSEANRLRVLIIENNDEDFDLCIRQLNKSKLDAIADRIRTPEQYEKQATTKPYDIVLAACDGMVWTGLSTFEGLRSQGIDIPLILMTGALNEEEAVEYIKIGVADFVLKSHLGRLPRAIHRALDDKRIREERVRSELALQSSEKRFRILVDSISLAVFIHQGPRYCYANRAAEILTGYSQSELLSLDSWDLVHPESRDFVIEQGFARLKGEGAGARYDMKILTRSGEARWLDVTFAGIELDGQPAGISSAFDITDRKLYETNLKKGAACDPLTGLPTKSHLQHALQSELKRIQRGGRPGAVLLFQFDEWERAKQNLGALGISSALCRLANVIGTDRRSADVVGRSGENEFVVVLPETPDVALDHLAGRMLDGFKRHANAATLTLHAGAAVIPRDGNTFDAVLNAARRNLGNVPNKMERLLVS
jgi:PAS domain S-box-containing protein/diguanylate cyclase (GGDEF)-like protein